VARVRTTSPDVRPTRSRAEPIVGVLVEALGAAGVAVTPETLDRIFAVTSGLAVSSAGVI
ncbi:MAG TPA: hypothetical protein VJN88_14050, partial [Ktedonobacterales bacterium]|nr:hypothetical protein [Ktedonobacterales bacterium]